MDGLMCEDIRIGYIVRMELRKGSYHWRRKDKAGYSMRFCSELLEMAGGIEKFLAEWERVPQDG